MAVFDGVIPAIIGAANAAGGDLEILRSLRFNSGDSAYLDRIPSSAGNRQSWTWSGWVKQSSLATSRQCLFGAYGASNDTDFLDIGFDGNSIYATVNSVASTGTAKYRDPSAWFHYFVRYDGSNLEWFINGDAAHTWARTGDLAVNGAFAHQIGRSPGAGGRHFDGYLAEVHLIDGQVLAATDFGEYDDNNVWQPKAYSGSYGTNGFYLKFADNSSNAALGTDSSGNNNTWTVNNINAADGTETTVGEATGALPIRNTTGDQGGTPVSGFRSDSFADDLFLALPLNTDTSDVSNSINTSSTTKSITNQNTATSSTQSRFYGASSYWNSNADGILVAESGSELVVGTGDFTIELWFYDDSNHGGGGSGRCYLFDNRIGGSVVGDPPTLTGYVDGSATINYGSSGGGTISHSLSTDDKWIHFAAVRNSGTTNLYINGTSVGSHSDTTDYTNNGIGVGRATDANYGWAGYIQDFRVYKAAKYTSDFNPPALADPAVGADCDSLIDSPINYTADSGNNGGNYATLNPLVITSTTTLANGNLDVTSSGQTNAVSTIAPSSGKWYFEITLGSIVTNSFIGLFGTTPLNSSYVAYGINGYGFLESGWGSPSNTVTGTGSTGDIIGLAFDADAKTLEYYRNGSSIGTISGWTYVDNWSIGFSANSTLSTPWVFNFGQRPFVYTPPTNYLSLCSTNLDDPTIADGGTAMNAALYTGNGASNSITGLGFAPDILWIKSRSNATFPALANSVVGPYYFLRTNGTNAESGPGFNDDIVSFDSDGFTLGADTYYAFCNTNTYTYVGWAWDSGTSTVTNTDGSISAQVRANQSTGCSVITWTASTESAATIGHGLGKQPELIIAKSRSNSDNFYVFHPALDTGGTISQTLYLNGTNGKTNITGVWGHWTEMNSSTFGIYDTSGNYTNNGDMVAFCFTSVEGFSSFGTYRGNGQTDGPFINTGFRPKWIMIKEYSASGNNWNIYDTSRNEYNVTDAQLKASSGDAEATNTFADYLSNGFKIRSNTSGLNTNLQDFIYAAFAEHPFKTARAR